MPTQKQNGHYRQTWFTWNLWKFHTVLRPLPVVLKLYKRMFYADLKNKMSTKANKSSICDPYELNTTQKVWFFAKTNIGWIFSRFLQLLINFGISFNLEALWYHLMTIPGERFMFSGADIWLVLKLLTWDQCLTMTVNNIFKIKKIVHISK